MLNLGKSHQEKALDFMSQRENGPIPDDFRLWKPESVEGLLCHRHVITKLIARVEQNETGGGILADEMGMGKSLSILALILRTLGAAHEWSERLEHQVSKSLQTQHSNCHSPGTLIVASSDLMINEWLQEIDK
ncbi:hypothetical protein E8E13_003360 [Curvularia kusanoi]|uniref:SNF2 N-terminal domain-containing protein n=1 Tax=Curvularia kusanoi TaxID=90978 RepID=A0A9P4W6M6_CURKU|nr:hypothetical protein E8E13_003360 [Curvularia kusanoi]